jgi:large conductance mechanosensitive channel
MWKEFKAFAMKGNAMDMAIGIIIGAAFGQIVSSLVSDIIMPPLGLALGHIDFNDYFVSLNHKSYPTLADAKKAGATVIAYGHFVNTIIDFFIVAFAIFLVVKWFSRLKKPEESVPTTKNCPYCISAIPIKAVRCPQCTSELQMA